MTLNDKQKQILTEHCGKCWEDYAYVIGVTLAINEKDKQITTHVVVDKALNDEEWSLVQYETIQGIMCAGGADATIYDYSDVMEIVVADELTEPESLGWVYQKVA